MSANDEDSKEVIIKTIAEIVNHLIKSYEKNEPINLVKLKSQISKKYKVKKMPKVVDIINSIPENYKAKLTPYLKVKPIRTASGVAVVAVMCKPHRCPHLALTGSTCIYCPGGPDSDFEYSSQSYTGYEPTSMRAIRARYDPYLQAKDRIEQLKKLGHDCDKVEYVLMGGTFMSLPSDYRDYFIRNLHDALSGHCSVNHQEAVKYSEQSIFEDVARDNNRGHTVESVKQCFKMTKDAGLKIASHMMPDLPNMGFERDIESFKEFFDNPDFRTDGLKLYPTLVIRGTGLYELWKKGKYRNYPPSFLVDLTAKVLAIVPPWVRVFRVQRDIPMPLVTSGVENGNLRNLALQRMKDLNLVCRDVRTREVGIQEIHNKVRPENVELIRRDYFANDGWETFLSYEDPKQDILIGLLRLRKCGPATFRPELKKNCSIVRELHVYGSVVPVHSRDPSKFQHQGYGTMLMEEAERIAKEEHGSTKLAVISGVGVRSYYAKLGFRNEGPYMVKDI